MKEIKCICTALFAALIVSLIVSGCQSVKPAAEEHSTKTINFYSVSGPVNLYFKEAGNNGFSVVKMSDEGGGWWKSVINTGPVQFSFVDSKYSICSLGGTMGEYPKDPDEDFTTTSDKVWVKNGIVFNYDPDKSRPAGEIAVLTLNMHTYQEDNQDMKFGRITRAINDLDPDIVVLQECAQHKDSKIVGEKYGKTIRTDNMAYIITEKLKKEYGRNYDYFWDWSHYGWDVWEEGTAVLSKHQIVSTENRYVSRSGDKKFWKSRNITMIQTELPGIGRINVFSAHMGWWDDKDEPFQDMFIRLDEWIESRASGAAASFVCGDFNVEAGSAGYNYVMGTGKFVDAYYQANPEGFYDPTIGGRIDGWKDGDAEGKRIDYMFLLKGGSLNVDLAQRIFTEKSYGRVSDHNGVYFFLSRKP